MDTPTHIFSMFPQGDRIWKKGLFRWMRDFKMGLSWITWQVLVAQSCLTLCNPMYCSPPCSSVHGILQARVLEWVAMPSPGDLPDPGIEPGSPALQSDPSLSEPPGLHPKSNDKCPYNRQKTQTHRGDGPVKTEAEVGNWTLQL